MSEKLILNETLIEASKRGWRLFRQNVGSGWAGKAFKPPMPMSVRINPSDVVVRDAFPLTAGLCKGSSDLIGWKPTLITQEMVGSVVAIFTAVEVKFGATRTSPEQTNFIEQLNSSGGLGKIIRSAGEL